MSYSPPPLNSQREGRRYLVSPLFVESGCLEPVERAVHLNRGQMLRGVGKLIDLTQATGVELPSPLFVPPPGCAVVRGTSTPYFFHPPTITQSRRRSNISD